HPKSKNEVDCISPNTVLKWSRALQAAFERVNKGAGKKCVRGVVHETKLLAANPWSGFTWISGRGRHVRQFDFDELMSFLDYLDGAWQGVTVAAALAKTFIWSRCRLDPLTSLEWTAYRSVGSEHHFHIVEKRGVEWWFRLPEFLFRQLEELRRDDR